MSTKFREITLLLAVTLRAGPVLAAGIVRHDFFVNGDSGIRLFVREVRQVSHGRPVLLVHGARVPGVASFDLPVPGGSLAADLAARNYDVFVMDVRGYGRSTRPAAEGFAVARSNQAVRDIGAVIDAIRARRRVSKVALFGWATGGQWTAHYASLYPDRLSALILLNSLYRGGSTHALIGRGTDSENPAHPGQFNNASCRDYRLNDALSIIRPWDRTIPDSSWRDPDVASAYVQAALASDDTSASRTTPSFRSPCGAMEDSFYLATGRQLWDDSLITTPVLVIAGERDFWSRPADLQSHRDDLVHSSKVRTVVIPNATHFLHLERPNHGRDVLLQEISQFLEHG